MYIYIYTLDMYKPYCILKREYLHDTFTNICTSPWWSYINRYLMMCVCNPLDLSVKNHILTDQWEFQDPKIALTKKTSYGVGTFCLGFLWVSEMAIEQIPYSLDLWVLGHPQATELMDRIAQLEAQVSDRRGSRGFHGAMALEPRRLHQRKNWGLCQVGWVETSSLVDFFRFFLCSWVFEAISCYFCMLGIADQMQNTTPRSLEHLAGANGNGSLPWWLRCHPPGVSASAVTGLGFSNPSRNVQHLALKDGFSLCFPMLFRVRPWMN